MVWKRLKPQRVVLLLGVISAPLQLISEWAPGGNFIEYIDSSTGTDRFVPVSGLPSCLSFRSLLPQAIRCCGRPSIPPLPQRGHGSLKGVRNRSRPA